LVATIVGSLIYALRGRNVKQMIRLYPEEKNAPLPSRIFLRAYRVFILIVIPGLPIYFITLKLVGAINWAWWWVLLPLLLIYAPFLLFCIIGGIWDTYRQLKAPKKGQDSIRPWPTIPSGYNPNEGKCGWHFAQGYKKHIQKSLDRGQHYIFVHEVLRDLFFDEPQNIVAIFMADGANGALLDLWHRVGKVFEDSNPSSPDGLGCEVRTLDNDTVVVLITLPPPQLMCEAHLVALVYRPASAKHEGITRFIVLEHDSSPMLCEWENVDTHCNMGYRCEPNLESFFEVVRELVSLDGLIWPLRIWSGITLYCRKWKIKQILKRIFTLQVTKKDEGFSKIAEQIAERHNKHGVTLTDPRTGKDLLAGTTDEQREKFRQFKIKNR